mmetsp:Transcript_7877/g.21673  ORF Transcript_7877/g.21673 Transcript_7877/m.21673 type:complete len:209 (-) Transcript_7877:1855-2481(-)
MSPTTFKKNRQVYAQDVGHGVSHTLQKLRGCKILVPRRAVIVVLGLWRKIVLGRGEVSHIGCVLDLWHVGRRQSQRLHGRPIEGGVPIMFFDVLRPPRLHRQTLAGFFLEKPLHNILQGPLEGRREDHTFDSLHHLGVDLHGRRGFERRVPRHELIQQDSEGPPVHALRVGLGGNQLRCEVVRCAARGKGLPDHELREPHVGELHVPT